MSEFDKWWEENCMILSSDRTEAEDIYNLGVESQQAKIDLLEVQLKGAEERAKLALDHKNRMVDELQKENDRLNTWYKNVKLQLENKQIDCDRSDKERDELQARVDRVVHILTYTNHASTPLCNELRDILKGNKDEN